MTKGQLHWQEYAMEGALLGIFMVAALRLPTPGVAGAPGTTGRECPPAPDGVGHGAHGDPPHLLTVGPAVGGPHESLADADLLPFEEDQSGRRARIHHRAVPRRRRGRARHAHDPRDAPR